MTDQEKKSNQSRTNSFDIDALYSSLKSDLETQKELVKLLKEKLKDKTEKVSFINFLGYIIQKSQIMYIYVADRTKVCLRLVDNQVLSTQIITEEQANDIFQKVSKELAG